EGGAAEDCEVARQDECERMAGLVNDEVDPMHEPKRSAAPVEVEIALEDVQAEHRHHGQAESPTGDGDSPEKELSSLRTGRRTRKPPRDGHLRRRRTPPRRPHDGSRDREWSGARRTAGTSDRAAA